MTEVAPSRSPSTAADRRARSQRLPVGGVLTVVGLVGAAATLSVSALPSVDFAYRSTSAHAAIETAAFLIASIAAALVAGRALRSGARADLLLAAGLALLAATNLVFGLLPTLFSWSPEFSSWGALAGRLAGALALAAAALLPDRRLVAPAQGLVRAAVGVVGFLVLVALVMALAEETLPTVLDPQLSPERAGRPRIVGHAAVLAVQVVLIFVYVAATIGFAMRARRRGDRLLRGFAAASLLAAFARVNYFLFPSIYSEWVYTGDVLRLAQYLVILGVVTFEVLRYQRGAQVAAVLDERRRVARELHDGLAQELAYIRAEASRVQRAGGEQAAGLVATADRAIDEARAAIATLSRPVDESLRETLQHGAEAVALRAGARVRTEGLDYRMLDADVRHALVRIVREATGNAVRHGGARELVIRVEDISPLRVTISDDGKGFDPSEPVRAGAYGVEGMRDRAEGFGGTLEIRSARGEGTTVEVVLP